MSKQSKFKSFNSTTLNETQPTHGFLYVFQLLLFSGFVAVLAQNVFKRFSQQGEYYLLGIIGSILLFVFFILIWGKKLFQIIDTPYFAVSTLLSIATGTALGTFIIQNLSREAFIERYGIHMSKLFGFLFLDDVFHSWWFILLFILLIGSLLKISSRKKFNKGNLGFHLSHLGPILILAGFWVDYYIGYRGLMPLQTGQSSSTVKVYTRNTNKINEEISLPFKLKLDYFKSEMFDPDYRIQIWKNDGTQGNQSRIVASVPVELDHSINIYDTDISFKIKEFYPNFFLEYSYPERYDSLPPKNPGILIELQNPHGGGNVLQLRSNSAKEYKFDDPILGFTFSFYWDLPSSLKGELDNFQSSSPFAKSSRIVFSGAEKKIYEIYNGALKQHSLEEEKIYLVPGSDMSKYRILSVYPDASYLESQPSTFDDRQLNPVAKLGVSRQSWKTPKDAFLFPSSKGPGGQFLIEKTPYLLALESIKDKETKYWESGISIITPSGEELPSQRVVVNEPLTYMGYKFYQSDYDPNNSNYSGIGVSYHPGLMIVYIGFYVLVIGVSLMFYFNYRNNQEL